jgi:hypothetical protein
MTDITGKVIYSNHHKENRIQVDANSFHTGLYFVTIKTGDYAKTIKLIKE